MAHAGRADGLGHLIHRGDRGAVHLDDHVARIQLPPGGPVVIDVLDQHALAVLLRVAGEPRHRDDLRVDLAIEHLLECLAVLLLLRLSLGITASDEESQAPSASYAFG